MTARRSSPAGDWLHLAARFFDVITARALDPRERAFVRSLLADPAEEAAFFGQPNPDQRHGYRAARHVERAAPHRRDLVRAALLHDVGKRHSGLGPMGRVAASVASRARLPLPPRWRMYRDHGSLGAAELAHAEEPVVVFARHHHHGRPPVIDEKDWEILLAADRARWGR